MRCTKCHYLSFEPEPRCRNCGHDLSLEEGSPFSLIDAALEVNAASAASESRRTATAVLTPPRTAAAPAANRIPTSELPLFVRSMQGAPEPVVNHAGDHDGPEDLEPLVKVPARPRTPVSVRRATPDPAKLRAKYGLTPTPEPDLWSNIPADPIDSVDIHDGGGAFQDLPLTSAASKSWQPRETPAERVPVGWQAQPRAQDDDEEQETVGAGRRLMSAAIDAAILIAISAVVIYLTLRVAGLSLLQVGLLPALPMAGLLLIITVGYFVMFTLASGQTLGKMAMHIKVVDSRLVRL